MKLNIDDNTYKYISSLAMDCGKTPAQIVLEILRMVANNEVLLANNSL